MATRHAASILRADLLALHNATRAAGEPLEFRSGPEQWGYSVSLPVDAAPSPVKGLQPSIVVEIHVLEGSVGIGALDSELRRFVTSEIDTVASGRPARVELPLDGANRSVHLMVRNTSPGGRPAHFKLLGASLTYVEPAQGLLTPKSPPDVPALVHRTPPASGTFEVLISHSSRRWFADHCDRGYLASRFAKPDRLRSVPPFESLPPNQAPYHGMLSVLRIELSRAGVDSHVARHYTSVEKVVHAATMTDRVLLCFDAGMAVFPRARANAGIDIDVRAGERLSDPWFGGLHTVIPIDRRTCLVSSSGADGILWLDVEQKKVVRRWRLPAERYGTNYALDETTSLTDHYIPNDLQLGHLNCASPDGRGGVYFSVLGQGDVGHLDPSGACDILASGHVGCHGVRYSAQLGWVYFCDSCGGRLMRIDGDGRSTVLFDAGSRWLHDAVHLSDGLFLLALGDRNQLVLADAHAGRRVAEWDFTASEGTIQFLSLADER